MPFMTIRLINFFRMTKNKGFQAICQRFAVTRNKFKEKMVWKHKEYKSINTDVTSSASLQKAIVFYVCFFSKPLHKCLKSK